MHDELDALLHLSDLVRQRGLAELDASAGFVDEVDGLVGQEAVGDVAIRMRNSELDRGIGVADRMEFLVAVLDAHDDLDGVSLVGRRNLDGLEAALEGTILLDRLAVFAGRGCSDALNFSARERGLEDVGRVERTLGGTCANQGVQLVDKDDRVLVLHQLFHDGLQALFELTAILCSGNDEREIQTKHALIGEKARHFSVGNALGKAFDDGRLADAWLADEHRIIFCAAAENLDHALEFAVAADQRIELPIHGRLGQVAAELG